MATSDGAENPTALTRFADRLARSTITIVARATFVGRSDVQVGMLLIASVAALLALGIETYVFTVAYPNFARVGAAEFPAFHALHTERIAFSIGPALLVSAFANGVLALERPREIPLWLPLVATAAGIAVLAYTAIFAVPLHARLSESGYDARTIARLNAGEPIRALATLVQAACDVAMVAIALRR